MRAFCEPYIYTNDEFESARQLKRTSHEKEDDLQKWLDDHPESLPIDRLSPGFSPLVSLGREIRKIDNLFLSPSGRLTVVEAKLWRNPEATRKVLSQILDYASDLSSLSYEQFEKACQTASGSHVTGGQSLFQLMQSSKASDLLPHEDVFHDSFERNLRNGRFMLLIAGDGIRENLESLLEALHEYSNLQFTFGLVEIRLYQQPDNENTIVIPNLVAHSKEIVRATVKIEDDGSERVSVNVTSGTGLTDATLSETEFVDSLDSELGRRISARILDWVRDREGVEIHVSRTFLVIRTEISNGKLTLPLIRINKGYGGRIRVTPPMLRKELSKIAATKDEEALWIARQISPLLQPATKLNIKNDNVLGDVNPEQLSENIDKILDVYSQAVKRLRSLEVDESKATEDKSSEGEE